MRQVPHLFSGRPVQHQTVVPSSQQEAATSLAAGMQLFILMSKGWKLHFFLMRLARVNMHNAAQPTKYAEVDVGCSSIMDENESWGHDLGDDILIGFR